MCIHCFGAKEQGLSSLLALFHYLPSHPFAYTALKEEVKEKGVSTGHSTVCSKDADASVAIASLYRMTCVTEHLVSWPWKCNCSTSLAEIEKGKAVAGSIAFCKN